jgi:hypothetical protein
MRMQDGGSSEGLPPACSLARVQKPVSARGKRAIALTTSSCEAPFDQGSASGFAHFRSPQRANSPMTCSNRQKVPREDGLVPSSQRLPALWTWSIRADVVRVRVSPTDILPPQRGPLNHSNMKFPNLRRSNASAFCFLLGCFRLQRQSPNPNPPFKHPAAPLVA